MDDVSDSLSLPTAPTRILQLAQKPPIHCAGMSRGHISRYHTPKAPASTALPACRTPFERMGDSPRLERRGSSSPPALPPDWGPLEPLLFDGPSHGRAARANEPLPPSFSDGRDRRAAPEAQPERQYSAGNRYFQRRGLVKAVEPPLIDVVEFSLKHLGGRACRMTKRMLLQARPGPSPNPRNPNPISDPTPAMKSNPTQEINTHMTHRHDDNAAAVAQLGAMPPLRAPDLRHLDPGFEGLDLGVG